MASLCPLGLPVGPLPLVKVYDATSAIERNGFSPNPTPPAVGTLGDERVDEGGGGGGGAGADDIGRGGGAEGALGGGGSALEMVGVTLECACGVGGGGGGGGAAAGDVVRNAFRAACAANEGSLCPLACGGVGATLGGLGAVFLLKGGGRGARPDGGAGGPDDVGGGGGGGAGLDGLREVGGGSGGFFPMGGGGLGFEASISGVESVLENVGLRVPFRAATLGMTGADPGGSGGTAGGRGAVPFGMAGAAALGDAGFETARDAAISGSESYAPVFTPPDFLNLGMPPATTLRAVVRSPCPSMKFPVLDRCYSVLCWAQVV